MSLVPPSVANGFSPSTSPSSDEELQEQVCTRVSTAAAPCADSAAETADAVRAAPSSERPTPAAKAATTAGTDQPEADDAAGSTATQSSAVTLKAAASTAEVVDPNINRYYSNRFTWEMKPTKSPTAWSTRGLVGLGGGRPGRCMEIKINPSASFSTRSGSERVIWEGFINYNNIRISNVVAVC